MFKIILKGALRGLLEVLVTIAIPLYVIYTLATKYITVIPNVPLTLKGLRYPYSIEEIIIILAFVYILIAILEEHKTWRVLGASLKMFIAIICFLILYTLLNGGILNYSGTIMGYDVIATIDIRIFLYLYGVLIVFPSLLAFILEISGKASGASE